MIKSTILRCHFCKTEQIRFVQKVYSGSDGHQEKLRWHEIKGETVPCVGYDKATTEEEFEQLNS